MALAKLGSGVIFLRREVVGRRFLTTFVPELWGVACGTVVLRGRGNV
ncbi:MAG: hypothetical protein LBV38_04690 [Alistipes sp.]|nr:hypothetical protein [Alistipes sp.]